MDVSRTHVSNGIVWKAGKAEAEVIFDVFEIVIADEARGDGGCSSGLIPCFWIVLQPA